MFANTKFEQQKKFLKSCFVNQVITSFFHMLEKLSLSLSLTHTFRKENVTDRPTKESIKVNKPSTLKREGDKSQEKQKECARGKKEE